MTRYLLFVILEIFNLIFLPAVLAQYFRWHWLLAGLTGIVVSVGAALAFAAVLSGMRTQEELRGWRL